MYSCTYITPIDTQLGYIQISADDIGITRIKFSDRPCQEERLNDNISHCRQQLAEYFTAGRTEFSVSLHPIGTPFQLKAWQILQTIPYGQTFSYKQQACQLGSANFARAVGLANSKNPLSIIVPCHRVIGFNQKLTGYAGGLNRKKALLMLENAPFSL